MKKTKDKAKLRKKRRAIRRNDKICPHCGDKGPHYVEVSANDPESQARVAAQVAQDGISLPYVLHTLSDSLNVAMDGVPAEQLVSGFWTCPIYYDKHNGRRMSREHVTFPPGFPRKGAE